MTDPGPEGLRIANVSRRFGRMYALERVTLALAPGDTLAIFGNNGAGKSTLLNTVAGLLTPSSGTVTFREQDIFKSPAAFRRHVGYISHHSFLYSDLTARENLLFYGRLYRIPEVDTRTSAMLEQVGLTARADDPIRTFSRGMHQRIAVARAFMHDPVLLLLDEPWSGLDRRSGDLLSGLLAELRGRNRIIMLTTHDLDRGLQMATHCAILNRGRLSYAGDYKGDAAEFQQIYETHV